MKHLFDFSHYLFVLAHPDDEIYNVRHYSKTGEREKRVDILYVTSGDYQGPEMISIWEEEARKSLQILNVPAEKVHFMRVQERLLVGTVHAVREQLLAQITNVFPDRIVWHDFEGGHNGHDAVSFCASHAMSRSPPLTR